MDLDDKIRRGHRAKAILDDAVFKEAVAHIDAELWRLFRETPPTDAEALGKISQAQYFHTKYLAFFKSAMFDGEQAKLEADWKKKRRGLSDVVTAIRKRVA